MLHDGAVSEPTIGAAGEVILVVSPRAQLPEPSPFGALLGVASGAVARVTAQVEAVVGGVVGATLDAVVPVTVGAVLDRIDLTSMVLQRVDLRQVVQQTLAELDLTEIVLENVDVDAIVEKANLTLIIDRLPLIDLANYIIDEIDLPSIIRDSTGGMASDAMNSVRLQTTELDDVLTRVADRMLFRRRHRQIDAPGTPESMQQATPDEADAS